MAPASSLLRALARRSHPEMEFLVDLDKVTAVLVDVDDLSVYRVRVAAPLDASPHATEQVHRLDDVLRATNVARLVDEEAAWLRPDAIRFHAAGQVPEDWEQRFDAACRAATTAGGEVALRAEVVWPGGARATGPQPATGRRGRIGDA